MNNRKSFLIVLALFVLIQLSPQTVVAIEDEIIETESEGIEEKEPDQEQVREEKQRPTDDTKEEEDESSKLKEEQPVEGNTEESNSINEQQERDIETNKAEQQQSSSLSLKIGDTDDRIVGLKQDLERLGFPIAEDQENYYGKSTEEAVKNFQKYYDLDVTGIVDADTQAEIDGILSSPLQIGKRHEDTVKLKKDLAKLGFSAEIEYTDYYGSKTEQLVKDFQENYDLVVNGIADDVTLAKIEELLEIPMQKGLYREDVVELKVNLEELGFRVPGQGTNYFGSKTEQKVKEFQEYYDLDVTGIVDEATQTEVDEILSSPLQKGNSHEDTVELKENLARLGFDAGLENTDYYGGTTEQLVKEFQEYYGLVVNGIADDVTTTKIDEILSSPLQKGNSHEDAVQLKENLAKLGFEAGLENTDYYGGTTEQLVKEFQEYYGLVVNGIADDVTTTKIDEILSSPLQKGNSHEDTVQLKKDLAKLGFDAGLENTTYYGSTTEQLVRDFQDEYGLPVSGIADEVTLETLEELTKATRYIQYDLTLNEAVDIQMDADPQTDQNYAYVSENYIENGSVTASALNVRSGPGTSYERVGTLYIGDAVNILDEVDGWYAIEHDDDQQWVTPTPDDVFFYLNPDNFVKDEKQRFQFLDLSRPSNASVDMLNDYLKGKGTLEGQGQAFKDASKQHGISDIYLISHATLETGNGGSALAKGIKYNGKTVYNMYGVGAKDSCPEICGAEYAYEQGWFTPYDAIVGGAEFIGNNYVKAGQNTLYKMRWNPEAMTNLGYASHQYATDIGWAFKQVNTMYNMYQEVGLNTLNLEIPVYN